uniref:Solute carrier family 10 member 3 n=1 Tax=Sus scrofa TaxID=9823 RepID=A0A8D0ZX58_PIG
QVTGEPRGKSGPSLRSGAADGALAAGAPGRWPPQPGVAAPPPGLAEAIPTLAGDTSIPLSRADGKRLSDYSVGPNSKLNLVVKPLEKVLLEESAARRLAEAPPPPPAAWQLVSKVLGRHFSAADASRVLDQLQRDYERSLSRLTLDDIERLASRFLHPEVTEAMEKGFSNVCFIPGLCLRIRRWLPTAATTSLDHSQQGAPSRPVV